MKFITALALLFAAGVTAQDEDCEAAYIVTRCLSTETAKADACETEDYDCLCAAYEAIATYVFPKYTHKYTSNDLLTKTHSCYNNCPNDSRAPAARDKVDSSCRNASLYGTKTQTPTSAASTATDAESTSTLVNIADNSDSMPTNTDGNGGFQAGPTPTDNAAAGGAPQGAGAVAAAAGVVGAVMAML